MEMPEDDGEDVSLNSEPDGDEEVTEEDDMEMPEDGEDDMDLDRGHEEPDGDEEVSEEDELDIDSDPAGDESTSEEEPLDVDSQVEGCQECGASDLTLEELIEMGEDTDDTDDVADTDETEEPSVPVEENKKTIIARRRLEEKVVAKLIREMEDISGDSEKGEDSDDPDEIDLESLFDQD